MNASLYETDFHAWAQDQVAKMRAGRFADLDVDHLTEELEGMGASEKREIESRLVILIAHLLKWQFQPEQRSGSWRGTIRTQRRGIERLLRDSPSLIRLVSEKAADAYPEARELAADETGIPESAFPGQCGYLESELLNMEFWPD